MVGPRGSGKTTLLKMLTPEALEVASRTKNFRLASSVKFTGIFVPTDIAWNKQLEMFAKWGLPELATEALLEASFVASVMRNFALALHDRATKTVPQTWLHVGELRLDAAAEADIATALADIWGLKLRIASLLGLRAAAAGRIVELGKLASRLRLAYSDEAAAEIMQYSTPLVPQLTQALDALEALQPQLIGEKWCMLFDELELAPAELRRSLLSALRSVDDRLILKLAISPYSADLTELMSTVAAMPGHDHDEVWLSYGHKRESLEFSYALMRSVVRERLGQEVGLRSLLGESLIPTSEIDDDEDSDEDVSLSQQKSVKNLYAIDSTFKTYVDRVAGNLEALLASTGQKRAQNLRKVLPLVVVREAFRTTDDSSVSGRRYRSRKNAPIYSGASSLAAILEGNPRWIIGVMNALLEFGPSRIPENVQTAEIVKTRNRFRSLLSTIPVPSSPESKRGLLTFIDSVGNAFRESIVAADFNPDPVGTFIVDASASDALVDALGSAVNTGAIIHVPDASSTAMLTSMRGKRFRLSYLLATHYGLPLRLERAASLRHVLSKNAADDERLVLFDDF